MIRRRVLIIATIRSGRKQFPALVKICLCYSVGGFVPFRDQFAARPVLESRCNAAYDLPHPAAVPVVKVLARRPACHVGLDDPVLGVVSIALSRFGDKVPGGVIEVSGARDPVVRPTEI